MPRAAATGKPPKAAGKKARRHTFRAHPFDLDLELQMVILYRKHVATETKSLQYSLATFFDEGYNESEVRDAIRAFEDAETPTKAITYFRAWAKNFMDARRKDHTQSTTQYSDAW